MAAYVMQLATLERLRTRLESRPTMRYVQDGYDGAQHSSGIRNVSLANSDVQLMWTLFDYAAISGDHSEENDAVVTGYATTEGLPVSKDSRPADETSRRSNTNTEATDAAQEHIANEDYDTETHNFHADPMEDFLSEWTLFGTPWSAYYPDMALNGSW